MAETLLSIKFPEENPITIVLETGGKITGGMTMSLDMNQLLKTGMGKPFTLTGTTRLSQALLDKLESYNKQVWNDSKTATILHKVINGEEVLSSRFFKKGIFKEVNMIGDIAERGGKVMVDISMELYGEEGYMNLKIVFKYLSVSLVVFSS